MTKSSVKRRIKELVKPVAAPAEGGWILVDKQDRAVLSEGRSKGVGFGFAKRSGRTLTTVDPVSACKDYLSDRLYTEVTGKPYQACGLSTTKKDVFDTHAYLIMSVLLQGARALTKYPEYDKDVAALESNHAKMQEVINWLEDQLKVGAHTRVERISANQYVVIAPLYWVQATYLISLYALVIRAALYYPGGDIKTYLLTGLKDSDAYTVKNAWPRVERLIAGELPKQDFSSTESWHGAGICFAKWPPDPRLPVVTPTPSPIAPSVIVFNAPAVPTPALAVLAQKA